MQHPVSVGGLKFKRAGEGGNCSFPYDRTKVQGVNLLSTHLGNDCDTAKLVYKRIQQP